jgi:hypothetical protein
MNKDAKVIAWRDALKDKVCSRTDFASNLQSNHTPWELGAEMLGKVELTDKVILTLNLEFVEILMYDFGVKGKNIVFITDCQEKANILRDPRYAEVHVVVGDYLKIGNTNMKFDVIAINPPFNNNIDLQFVQKSIELCAPYGHVLVVHPAISSITRKPTKRYAEHKKILEGHVKSIKLFNGNPVFGIGLFYPCQIIHITPDQTYESFPVEYATNEEKHTDTFTSLFDITKWGKVSEYYSLEKKILDYCEKVGDCDDKLGGNEGCYKSRIVEGKYYLNISRIRGHVSKETMFKDDFYTMVTRVLKIEESKTKSMWMAFENKQEAENTLRYLKTNFARFALSILKTNSDIDRGELKSVPYFSSYAEEWTKERITKELGITEKEWAFIDKVIPPYYV